MPRPRRLATAHGERVQRARRPFPGRVRPLHQQPGADELEILASVDLDPQQASPGPSADGNKLQAADGVQHKQCRKALRPSRGRSGLSPSHATPMKSSLRPQTSHVEPTLRNITAEKAQQHGVVPCAVLANPSSPCARGDGAGSKWTRQTGRQAPARPHSSEEEDEPLSVDIPADWQLGHIMRRLTGSSSTVFPAMLSTSQWARSTI